jgi:plastocyanin
MSLAKRFVLSFVLVFLALASTQAFAVQDTIIFGGNTGIKYQPTPLTAHIGDTIVWRGDFITHPLRMDSVPKGADALGPVDAGTEYIYVIRAAGKYAYHCNVHGSFGMTGVINVAGLGVSSRLGIAAVVQFDQSYPNPVRTSTNLHFTLADEQVVTLRVYNVLGDEVATLTNARLVSGAHIVKYDATNLPSGHYFLRLQAGQTVITQSLTKTGN